jgi:hypothetical protein
MRSLESRTWQTENDYRGFFNGPFNKTDISQPATSDSGFGVAPTHGVVAIVRIDLRSDSE